VSGYPCVRPLGCFRASCAAEGRCRMDPKHPRFAVEVFPLCKSWCGERTAGINGGVVYRAEGGTRFFCSAACLEALSPRHPNFSP
jgi:hypothetical protein